MPPAPPDDAPETVDLFAGCGGLSLGFEACRFRSAGDEMSTVAAETYVRNLDGKCHLNVQWLAVSVFANAAALDRSSKQINWETEVWITDDPDHMIHFDDGRFAAPHEEGKEGRHEH